MNPSSFLTLTATVVLAAAAIGQTPQPKETHANPADKPLHNASSSMPTDAAFMKQLAVGGMAEVDAGKLAAQRSQNKEVKDFAQHMVDDHSKANDKLMSLAREQKVELPSKPDAAQVAKKTMLEKESGAKFDSEYVNAQVKAHEKTVELLKNQIDKGKNESIKKFAEETLPTVSHHLDMAKQLQAKVGATASPRTSYNATEPATDSESDAGDRQGRENRSNDGERTARTDRLDRTDR